MSQRPDNWFSMSFADQRQWEDREAQVWDAQRIKAERDALAAALRDILAAWDAELDVVPLLDRARSVLSGLQQ